MTQFPQKIKMKVAQQSSKVRTNLDHIHPTTMGMMRPCVAFVRNTIPNEKSYVSVNPSVVLDPMDVPTFGDINMHIAYYQVPLRVLSPQFNDFINDTTHTSPLGHHFIPTAMPYFTANTLSEVFADSDMSVVVTNADQSDYYSDFDHSFHQLTVHGSHALSLLHSLGYKLTLGAKRLQFNALRLLAVAKVYADYYYNAQYADASSDIFIIRSIFARDEVQAYELSPQDLSAIFHIVEFTNYNADFYTSLWDKPYSPNQENSSTFVFGDYQSPEGSTQVEYAPTDWIPLLKSNTHVTSGGANQIAFSQYMIDSLKALSDFTKRNQMAGTYSIDRYLSRFGTILSAEKLNRCVMIGQDFIPIEINQINSTADTENSGGSSLGSFAAVGRAGKAVSSKEYFSNEFCINLAIATIVPHHVYYQGVDRMNLISNKGEYFIPEYDNLGVDAVSSAEVFVNEKDDSLEFNDNNVFDQVFGYAPRYYYYKIARDVVSGYFSRALTSEQLLPWFFARKLAPTRLAELVHSPDFVSALDAEQYNRIFQTYEGDHFTVCFTNKIEAELNASSLFDTYQFNSKGDSIVIDTNGVKEN